jgi:hypothetical protein
LFARWNQSLEIQPQLKPRLLRLPAIIPNASRIEILSLLLIGDEFIFTNRTNALNTQRGADVAEW